MPSIKLIVTSDGSHSLLNEALDETYHSVHGAIQESEHVFIKNGLDHFLNSRNLKNVSILEVGFGTGLNALLTLRRIIDSPVAIRYTTLESFPLGEELWSMLNYTQSLGLTEYFQKLHRSAWDEPYDLLPNMELMKKQKLLQQAELPAEAFDIVYFDAFAPNKQPELWTIDVLKKIAVAMKTNAVLVTYCAKGQLKRDLKALGLNVETLDGPPGKKEMVRAIKPAL